MQETNAREHGADLIVSTLRRRFALIAACALVGVAAGWLYASAQPPSYTSSASVLINPSDGNPYAPSGLDDELTSLETEALLVPSDAVLQEVSNEVDDGRTPAELEGRLRVLVPANTQVLQISYEAADPEVARDTAQAFATAYLDLRRQRVDDVKADQLNVVETQLETALADLRAATAASQVGGQAKRAFQAELVTALNSELVDLRAQRIALENTSSQPGRIISPAALPEGGSALKEQLFPVAGGLAGLLLGFTLALLLERRRGRVWSSHDVEVTGVPVLARLARTPRLGRESRTTSPGFDDALRRVRAAVLEAELPRRTVAVAACSQHEAEPGIADALAASLARAGNEVIFVDADDRTDGKDLEPDEGPGLTDLLSGDHDDVRSALVPGDDRRIRVLPRGRMAPETSDQFVKGRLESALEPLVRECDFVVLRAPSLQSTQGEALAGAADVTIAVVTSGGISKSEFLTVAQRSHDSHVVLLGTILIPRRVVLPRLGRRAGSPVGEELTP